jgi:hypothetical protein
MTTESTRDPEEIEALLHLKRLYLRGALAVSGSHTSSPGATRAAGNEAAKTKTEIQQLEEQLSSVAA